MAVDNTYSVLSGGGVYAGIRNPAPAQPTFAAQRAAAAPVFSRQR